MYQWQGAYLVYTWSWVLFSVPLRGRVRGEGGGSLKKKKVPGKIYQWILSSEKNFDENEDVYTILKCLFTNHLLVAKEKNSKLVTELRN